VLDVKDLELSAESREKLANSLAAYEAGSLKRALELFPGYPQPELAAAPGERPYLASLMLAVGAVEKAGALLKDADSNSPPIRALQTMDRAVSGPEGAGEDAGAPRAQTASEHLANSYLFQSKHNLEAALAAAKSAVQLSPGFGFGWARVAELEFSFGRTAAARGAVERALQLSPQNAQAHAVNGFALAAENKINEAISAFNTAIQLDGALGNAWLGRGLCERRRGKAESLKQKAEISGWLSDLQAAAAAEPNRSLLRSYLGKGLADAGEPVLAEKELNFARKLDPKDPTPWLYSALLKQQQNKINQAIGDLEASQDRNENRSVVRSPHLLDEDAAVRGANLATIYRDAGMQDVSTREATRAVNYDYVNYSAHLFLANSYNQLRDPNQINLRYETPWLSEYLIANLLAPVGANTLSQTVSQQEYARLFEHDGMGIASSTEYLSRGNWLQGGAIYGNYGQIGFAVDELYRSDNGWRPNNDQEQLTLSAQIKAQVTPKDILFFQTIYYDASAGDLTQYYNQTNAQLTLRTKETQEPLLLAGYNHQWAPGIHTLILAGRFSDELDVTNAQEPVVHLIKGSAGKVVAAPAPNLPTAALDYHSCLEICSAEVQQIVELDKHAVVLGARYQEGTFDTRGLLADFTSRQYGVISLPNNLFPEPSVTNQNFKPDMQRITGYGYDQWRVCDPLLLSAGLSYDYLRFPLNYRSAPISDRQDSEERLSPKAGFTLTPLRDTVLRFAWTRSLGGVSLDQSVRLEPSQVAGFNQAFRSLIPESLSGSLSGAKFETFGLAVEQKFKSRTYLGVEADLFNSDVNNTVGAVDIRSPSLFEVDYVPSRTRQDFDYQEKSLQITLNQLVGDWWALGARYRLSRATLDTTFPDIPTSVTAGAHNENKAALHQLSLFGLLNHPSGFFARAEGLWYSQDNQGYQPAQPGDDFWHVNLFAGYRFFQRRAELQLGLVNITDRDYRLNPLNLYAELPRQRALMASFQFNF
jgi:Tfp pilus assembly protein PilF